MRLVYGVGIVHVGAPCRLRSTRRERWLRLRAEVVSPAMTDTRLRMFPPRNAAWRRPPSSPARTRWLAGGRPRR